MKLSDTTLNALKGFSSINSGMLFQKGSVLKTISPEETIRVEVEVAESFPVVFGIYDLPTFVSNLSLMNSPDMEFTENSVIIRDDDGMKFIYGVCSPEVISYPKEDAVWDSEDFSFNLSEKVLTKFLKLAAMNSFNTLSLKGVSGKITLKVHDVDNPISNAVSAEVSEFVGEDFDFDFKIELLKMQIMDFVVKVKTSDGFLLFENESKKYKYFVSSEI